MPAPDDPADLEFSVDDMRRMTRAVTERAIDHIAALGAQPACGDVHVEELARRLREPAPEEPSPIDPLLDRLFDEWIPSSFNAPGPGYLAYIPGGGLFPAALADFIADTANRYTGVWQAAPLLVQLEANALDWLRDWMDFPQTTRGLFTTGGSMANFNAILCARERQLGRDIRRGVMYTSTQVHHSVAKSARLAGVFEDRVRSVDVDDEFRMRVDALAATIRRDRAEGLTPFLVVSSAGTTNTGAVDPLDAIADLCAAEGLWHHVDGAYGAFFYMDPASRPALAGLPRADSLTLDPHKGMFLPYGTGALLVRDGAALRAAHHVPHAGYLPSLPDEDEFYDPSVHGPDLSRGFPGLRVWLCVKLLGAARFRAAIAEKRQLALEAADRIARIPGIVMDAPPQLSLFAFHLSRANGERLRPERGAGGKRGEAAPPSESAWGCLGAEAVAKAAGSTRSEDENTATRALMDRVTARGRVMLTGAMVDERYLGRVCVLSFRTRRHHVDACVDDVAAEAAAILSGARA
jgi:aromatic-L-amino-acid/L-tryptophan decarboxylase